MNRTNSAKAFSSINVSRAVENQKASEAKGHPPPPRVKKDKKPKQSDLVPTAYKRARAALHIQLPPSQRPRSNSESFSLQETYLGLHKELISSDRFHDYMVVQIRNNFDLGTLLAGSFEDGPITHSEILRNRLLFSLETYGENGTPVLVLEAMGETPEAAMELAGLAQRGYLRFVKMEESPSSHPRLSKQVSKLEGLEEENQSLENDLAAYRQLNKKPAKKNQEAELEEQLLFCRKQKTALAYQLKEISRAFSSNPRTIVPLTQLKGFSESKTIGLLGEQLGQLEQLTAQLNTGGNIGSTEKIKKLDETAKTIRARLGEEMNRSIALLKDRLEALLDREIALTEELVRVQNDFVNLASEYPKTPLLRASRRTLADFKQQCKQTASNWSHARKCLIAGELSKSTPPLRLHPQDL